MKTKLNRNVGDGGFSLVQLLTVFAIGGILAGLFASVYSNMPDGLSEAKLRSDVRTINRAIGIYQSFGGSLEGITSPALVVAKLQTVVDEASSDQVAGLAGSMLDRRLRPVMLAESESETDVLRANWDADEMRFVVAVEGENGVVRFELDESYAGGIVVEETRVQNFKLAASNGWIWEYEDNSASQPSGPTEILNTYSGSNPVDTGDGPTDEEEDGGDPGSRLPLDPPVFSIPGGNYPAPNFDLPLVLGNPNPEGVSRIVYRIGDGPRTNYTGPITVIPGNRVVAFAESALPAEWANSTDAISDYAASMVYLAEPTIETSAAAFDYEANENVLVSIGHENDELYSTVEYRVDGGAWQEYAAPFSLHEGDYPNPMVALIEARVAATPEVYPEYYEGSGSVMAQIDAALLPLNAPTITFSADSFSGAIYNGVYTDGSGYAGDGVVVGGDGWNDGDALVAEYRWNNDSGAWYATGGFDPGAVSISNTQTNYYGSPMSIDFISTASVDSVYVKKFYSSSHTINFEPATTAAFGIVNSNNHSFRRARFYYNGTGEVDPVINPVNAITVTLADSDNEEGTSELRYKIVGRDEAYEGYTLMPEGTNTDGFLVYSGAFDVVAADYPDGFGIQAYAHSPGGSHLPSPVAFDQIDETPVLTISGSANGVFMNPTGGTRMVTNLNDGESSSYFEWGNGINSSIEFTGSSFIDANEGERFLLGTIDYFNGTSRLSTTANSIDLALSLNFDLGEERAFDFNLELINTPNDTETEEGDADYVSLYSILSLSTTMIYDWDFDLKIEFGETTEEGFSTIDQFHVFEGESARGNIYGTLLLHE